MNRLESYLLFLICDVTERPSFSYVQIVVVENLSNECPSTPAIYGQPSPLPFILIKLQNLDALQSFDAQFACALKHKRLHIMVHNVLSCTRNSPDEGIQAEFNVVKGGTWSNENLFR